ncbi:retrovirus-related pol polyprotein from transposon TNT 1-94, partial [Tanacetum coccineum]
MSINHEKYTLVIVDEYSRTDNGSGFRNHELESFFDEKGICQNFSSPYTPEQNGVAERKNRTLIEIARTMLNGSVLSKHFWTEADHLSKFDAKADDGYFLGYSFVSKAFRIFNTRRQQVEETYHVTFDESIEAIRFTNTSYIIPHGRSLTQLTQENHVPEVIAPNKPDIPHTRNTKGNNTKVSRSIIESLVPDVTQSHISNQDFTSSHHIPQDRWSRDQHIELVNVIGDPGEGMLTRSMAAKLAAALA